MMSLYMIDCMKRNIDDVYVGVCQCVSVCSAM